MRGVSRQAQVRWEGHQEAGLPREGLRRHDDDDGEGQTATAAGTNCIKIGLPGKLILSNRKGPQEILFS